MSGTGISTLAYFIAEASAAILQFGAPNGDYTATPVPTREMTACGITVIAKDAPDAFSLLRPKDICRARRSVERVIDGDIGNPKIYFVPLMWNETKGFPKLVENWENEVLRDYLAMAYVGMYYSGTDVVQVSPIAVSTGLSETLFSSSTHNVRRWYAMTILSHELMHHSLTLHNVPLPMQHCVMAVTPSFWLTSIEQLGKDYAIDQDDIDTLVRIEQEMYKDACTSVEFTFEE